MPCLNIKQLNLPAVRLHPLAANEFCGEKEAVLTNIHYMYSVDVKCS